MKDKNPVNILVTCFHCGLECNDDSIVFEEKSFCCSGCKAVYEILNKGNLCDYYSFESNPGLSPKNSANDRFNFLDDDDTASKLLDFKEDKLAVVTFNIPQMHCSSCIWLLENLYKLDKRISNSRVDFLKKKLKIHFSHQEIELKEIVILLSSIGYEPQILLDSIDNKSEANTNRKLVYKIGIAGFCFGNIMLFSFPEYLSIDVSEIFFKKLFSYLNLLLALPVFFYASSDYFISAIKGLKKKIVNLDVPISLGILTLFIRSSYDVITQTGAGYFDSLAGLVFFLLIGKYLQEKTYNYLNFERNYKSYFPLSVTILLDGIEKSIPLSNLMIGNRIIVRQGELIPADSILFNGDGRIDYSFVTGESKPVKKVSGEMIYAGGRQVGAAIELEVVKDVSQSYLTQLWNNDTFNKNSESSFTNFSNAISKYFTIVVLFIAFVSTAFWIPVNLDIAVNVFTSVLIIACPCALALSTPFTLGNAMRIFGRNNFFVKNSAVVEKLNKINTVVFDKTGTITQPGKSDLIYNGIVLNHNQLIQIKSLVRNSTHPLSKKIFKSIETEDFLPVTAFREINGKGIEGIAYGEEIKIGSGEFIGFKGVSPKRDFLQTEIHLSIGGEYLGFFSVSNSYRTGIKELINNIKNNYFVSLLSGDNAAEEVNLRKIFSSDSELLFNQSPEDKLIFIKNLQQGNNKVLMIGDGLNDSGALSQSDVGISVTEEISNFTPASDAIISADVLPKLPKFLLFSKDSVKIIYLNFLISFFYNVIGLSFAVQGLLSPLIAAILMPLSSITVVFVATASTNIIAKKRGLLSQ